MLYEVNLRFEPVDYKPIPVKARPGTVIIAVHKEIESSNGVLLTAQESDNMLPSVGVCLSSGSDEFKEGDWVVCDPQSGKWITNAYGYDVVRMLGCEGIYPDARRGDIGRYCLGVLEKGSGRFIPSQNNVLLKRDMPKQKTASGIELPRGVFGNTGLATVLEVGPNADPDIKAGDRVYYYSQGALIQPNESVEICYGAEKNSLLEIEDTFVLAKCDE